MRGPDFPLVLLKLTTFGKLILRKIIKIVTTRCHILQLKCTKFDFPPQTPLGSALDPLAGFKGRTSIGKGKDQEAVAVLEGARGLNLALAPG